MWVTHSGWNIESLEKAMEFMDWMGEKMHVAEKESIEEKIMEARGVQEKQSKKDVKQHDSELGYN